MTRQQQSRPPENGRLQKLALGGVVALGSLAVIIDERAGPGGSWRDVFNDLLRDKSTNTEPAPPVAPPPEDAPSYTTDPVPEAAPPEDEAPVTPPVAEDVTPAPAPPEEPEATEPEITEPEATEPEAALPENVIPLPRPRPTTALEAIQMQMVGEGKARPPAHISQAIAAASDYTGVDRIYLHRLAHAESTFNSAAHNGAGGGNGACGLYQYRRGTYLEQIYKHGDKFPPAYEHLADTVETYVRRRDNGKPVYGFRIKDSANREAVLEACYDPGFAAMLVGLMTLETRDRLKNEGGLRDDEITHAALYIAHFLGQYGGQRLLEAFNDENRRSSSLTAYVSAPQRRGNPGIFRHVNDVEDLYHFFAEQKGMTDEVAQFDTPQFVTGPAAGDRIVLPPPEDIPLPRPRPVGI